MAEWKKIILSGSDAELNKLQLSSTASYYSDYSSDYQDRTLVDKGWVDSVTGSLETSTTSSYALKALTSSYSEYVEFSNIGNKPTLVSGSSQISYTGITDIPGGIISSSLQLNTYVTNSLETEAITEKTNLYYTNVRVLDYINSIGVASGSTESSSYSETASYALNVDRTLLMDSSSYSEYVEFDNVGNKPTLVSGSSQIDHGDVGGLSDDDHTQYYNVTRLNTYISASAVPSAVSSSYAETASYAAYAVLADDSNTLGTQQGGYYLNWDNFSNIPEGILSGSLIPSSSYAETASYTLNVDRTLLMDSSSYAEYVEFSNVGNKPTLVSGSSQIDHGGTTGRDDDDHTQYYNVTRLNTYISASYVPGAYSSSYSVTASYAANADLLDEQEGTYYLNWNNFTGTSVGLNTYVSASLTTAEIDEETNLFYTVDRINSYVSASLTTAEIDEQTNLYYTVDRINSYVSASLTTSEIDEGDNEYYTDVKVLNYIDSQNVVSSSLQIDHDQTTNWFINQHRIINDGSVSATTLWSSDKISGEISDLVSGSLTLDNVAYTTHSNTFTQDQIISASLYVEEFFYGDLIGTASFATTSSHAIYSEDSDQLDNQEGTYYLAWNNFTGTSVGLNSYVSASLTTAEIDEEINLFYTVDRINSYVSASLTTAEIDEQTNLFYTVDRINSYVSASLTTSEIDEGTNEYYTDAKVSTWISYKIR